MELQKYQYTGQQPHNSTILVLEGGKKVRKDVRLAAGDIADLPADHRVIKDLVSSGLLTPVTKQLTANNKKTQ